MEILEDIASGGPAVIVERYMDLLPAEVRPLVAELMATEKE